MHRSKRKVMVALIAAPLSVGLWGCPQYQPDADDKPPGQANNKPAPNNSPNNKTNNTTMPPAEASAQYAQWCASCHGSAGEGGIGPKLTGWSKGRQALVEVIDRTMPTSSPELCTGACAEGIADLLLTGFTQEGCEPGMAKLPPRRLRLLNRDEYTQTIRDLYTPFLGEQAAAKMCLDLSSCDDPGQQTCQASTCQARPCDLKIFSFDPGNRQLNTVHIAGSFNGWPAQQAAGGLAMRFDASRGLWLAEAKLPDGPHQYKIVLNDQEWITDPLNPDRADDTFGGFNSVIRVSCEAGDPQADPSTALARDWSEAIPKEQRQKGFDFDNSVETLYVSALHLEAYLNNGESLGAFTSSISDKIVSCELGQDACARQLIERFGQRAFRRPLTEAELTDYVALIKSQPTADQGVEAATRAMLSSPHFLYRAELGQAQPDGSFKLSGYELASAMSYLYWGTMPDEALLKAAQSGELESAQGRLAQAKRMLADPRAERTLGRFAEQWLGIGKLRTQSKNLNQYPQFNDALRESMLTETRTFFTKLALDPQGRFKTLFEANYTYADQTMRAHYGLNAAQGSAAFERVEDTTGQRSAGLLTHASVLSTYAHSDQTSPVLRGLLVRSHLLCQEFPPPPANAGGVPEVDPSATTRERFSQHADNPACSSCHQFIDPVGFGFEHYDPIGQWRNKDQGRDIDATGGVKDLEGFGKGTDQAFESVGALGRLLAQSDSAPRCLTQQAYRFTYGYKESSAERCTIEDLNQTFKSSDYTIYELLLAIPQHPSFTHRQ